MSLPRDFHSLVTLDAAHPARARAPAPPCHFPGQLTPSSALHSHKRGRQLILTIIGTALPESCFGRKWTYFVFLDFADGLSQTCRQSSATTHRNSPLPWEGVALGLSSSRERSAIGLHRCLQPCLPQTNQVKQNGNNSTYLLKQHHHKSVWKIQGANK